MKLFQLSELSHDSEYTFYTAENLVAFMDKKHQGIDSNINVKLTLYKGKSEKEKAKLTDFNISTSLPYFFVNEEIKRKIESMKINAEFISVETDNNMSFYLVYQLNNIEIIDFTDNDDLLNMILDGEFNFIRNINLEGIYIFKDPNLVTDTFFTEEFINIFKDKLKGAIFTEVS